MRGKEKLFALLAVLILGLGIVPLLAQPLPYKDTDWLAYESVMYYGDSYEPDDTRAQAKSCSVDGPAQFHSFDVPWDQDWIRFVATEGMAYSIGTRAHSLGSQADTVIDLYDLNGRFLGHDDDSGKSSDAVLRFRPGYTGVHYARITEWTNGGGSAYWYYLRVRSLNSLYLPLIAR